MNYIAKFSLQLISILLLYAIFITPYQLYLFDVYTNIFPSFDLIIIFLLSIKFSRGNYVKLFFTGIFLDYLNGFDTCAYPIILIISELFLRYFRARIFLNFKSELMLFVYYISFASLLKYLILSMIGFNNIFISAVFMQYLITLLVYPLVYIPITKIFKIAKYS